ncbi:hypothetical protein CLF_104558 [Clonorchis sinensis]|uniref:Uncharacterized protein n=1 Tax=Clonorchis sinensis TaxID=79923 RepID=G7YBW8_CLOSI|nr:hypothetical protein CLF_104558 [Clonorchis sinensis]
MDGTTVYEAAGKLEDGKKANYFGRIRYEQNQCQSRTMPRRISQGDETSPHVFYFTYHGKSSREGTVTQKSGGDLTVLFRIAAITRYSALKAKKPVPMNTIGTSVSPVAPDLLTYVDVGADLVVGLEGTTPTDSACMRTCRVEEDNQRKEQKAAYMRDCFDRRLRRAARVGTLTVSQSAYNHKRHDRKYHHATFRLSASDDSACAAVGYTGTDIQSAIQGHDVCKVQPNQHPNAGSLVRPSLCRIARERFLLVATLTQLDAPSDASCNEFVMTELENGYLVLQSREAFSSMHYDGSATCYACGDTACRDECCPLCLLRNVGNREVHNI